MNNEEIRANLREIHKQLERMTNDFRKYPLRYPNSGRAMDRIDFDSAVIDAIRGLAKGLAAITIVTEAILTEGNK